MNTKSQLSFPFLLNVLAGRMLRKAGGKGSVSVCIRVRREVLQLAIVKSSTARPHSKLFRFKSFSYQVDGVRNGFLAGATVWVEFAQSLYVCATFYDLKSSTFISTFNTGSVLGHYFEVWGCFCDQKSAVGDFTLADRYQCTHPKVGFVTRGGGRKL